MHIAAKQGMWFMPKGNPNPSPETRIGKPRGPSPGQTKEQVAISRRNAETAMRIREKLLAAAEKKLTVLGESDAALEFIEAAMLKLLKDAEDRGLGTAVQSLNVESPNGSMTPNGGTALDRINSRLDSIIGSDAKGEDTQRTD